MDMKNTHLLLMRSLNSQGWPATLINHLLLRCGATPEQWQELVAAGYVELAGGRWHMTAEGRRQFNRQREGRYF